MSLGLEILAYIKFTYLANKNGRRFGGNGSFGSANNETHFDLSSNENVIKVIIYTNDRWIENSHRKGLTTPVIDGISLTTNQNRTVLFGSANGKRHEEQFENYHLGFVSGRDGGYIDALRFTWYLNCP